MADLTAVIETMEHRWMRAWVNGDKKALKSATSRRFMLLAGSKPPMILDRTSWLEAAANRWSCSSYRFGDIYVRSVGNGLAVFAVPLELKARMDGVEWSGAVFVTDIWRRAMTRRGWKMVQRVISRPDEDPALPKAIRALQLWK
jgi:hypothetical protein